jgi:hypothetical protein
MQGGLFYRRVDTCPKKSANEVCRLQVENFTLQNFQPEGTTVKREKRLTVRAFICKICKAKLANKSKDRGGAAA